MCTLIERQLTLQLALLAVASMCTLQRASVDTTLLARNVSTDIVRRVREFNPQAKAVCDGERLDYGAHKGTPSHLLCTTSHQYRTCREEVIIVMVGGFVRLVFYMITDTVMYNISYPPFNKALRKDTYGYVPMRTRPNVIWVPHHRYRSYCDIKQGITNLGKLN